MSVSIKNGALLNQQVISDVRKLNKKDKKIILEKGDYYITDPLCITSEDSGLSIESAGNGEARIIGGKKITNWKRKDDKLWSASLPQTKNRKWDFRMLIVNDRFANRARFPEQGHLLHETEFKVKWLSTFEGGFERKPSYKELTTLKYKPSDIAPDFEYENAELTIFHMWDESMVGIKEMNAGNNTFTFSNPTGWPPGAFADHYKFDKRYVIWNTKEGMLHPGQWYLDRKNGELVYWPLNNEDMSKAEVVAPVLENLFIIEGTKDRPVKDITIKNITLCATNAPLMSGAFGAKLFDGAISGRHITNCEFSGLHLHNVGAHGIKAVGEKLKIENNNIHHTGAGAIRYTGGNTLIQNNHIHHVGQTFPSAIALYVGYTDPNVPAEWMHKPLDKNVSILHNELHDVPYAAICCGGKNLKIEKNLIYRAMQDLYDGAGIYITFCENATVRHNFIRDIKDAPGAGTSAYYLDEKSIGCMVEENMEINVPRASHNHISENNTFRNNFFIVKDKGWFSIERSKGYIFENNVIVTENGYDIYDLSACKEFKNNIIFVKNGKITTKELDNYTVLSEYEIVLKDGNQNCDPKLLNYEDGKVVFAPDSLAVKMGIKPIDVSKAGLIK